MTDADVEALLEKVRQQVHERRLPEATYRLQFHKGFGFRAASEIVPYLHDLGITHCYASPFLKARPGSTHGYDITDHRQLNPEVGTEDDFAAWIAALRTHGLEQILDIVPNHMGVNSNENAWWNDVLENGPASPFAGYFDISWYASPRVELQGKILLPVLGDPYGQVLEAKQIQLGFEAGTYFIAYYEHRFPLDPRSFGSILNQCAEAVEQALPADDPALLEFHSIRTAISHLPSHSETDPAKVTERLREKEVVKRRLATLVGDNPAIRALIEQTVIRFNGQAGVPHSFDLLDKLLDEQPYRLAFWRVATDEINYRRFFDINDLAALSMEREEVFAAAHELIFRLLGDGRAAGLRIDHPDGLYDPKEYLDRLQQSYVLALARRQFDGDERYRGVEWSEAEPLLRARIADEARAGGAAWRPLYVVVEKILIGVETLPEDWPTFGTSGYDFLDMANGLFVDTANAKAFHRLYRDWTESDASFREIAYQKQVLIMQVALASELYMLAYQLDRLAQKNRKSRDFTLNTLRHALREVIAWFPVYRSYISERGVGDMDRRYIELAVRRAITRLPTLSRALFTFVRDMLLLQYPEAAGEADQAEQRRFAGKFQQVTAPVMAKGIEDTAFYNYNRLISLNEVGNDPERFGVTPDALHRYLQDRQARWPHALSPLSTHDTKRSEDVRARINVLSELPDEWRDALARWSRLNEPHRQQVDEAVVPDPNEECLIYQTLLGAWPLEPYGADEYADFVKRIEAYVLKALYEAKLHTSWISPNPPYDEAVQTFVTRILNPEGGNPFLDDFRPFQQRISHYGLLNSLAQTLLRIASPGAPDTYQGTELWDFSLVDPDNRRPVNYERRRQLLAELQTRVAADPDRRVLARELMAKVHDGRIKLYVAWQALQSRHRWPGLFSTGSYESIETSGARSEHVFAFVRSDGKRRTLVVVPRLFTRLVPAGGMPVGREVWQNTRLVFPDSDAGMRLRNVFTGQELTVAKSLLLADVLADFPVALLEAGERGGVSPPS